MRAREKNDEKRIPMVAPCIKAYSPSLTLKYLTALNLQYWQYVSHWLFETV